MENAILYRGTKRLLMMGIEVLAHREREQEGYYQGWILIDRLEVYVSEGRGVRSCYLSNL